MFHLKIKPDSAVKEYYAGIKIDTENSGLDIYCPTALIVPARAISFCIDLGIQCSSTRGYYLYPRSSTGSSTPLRLSNSVGIIDAGYRGVIKAFVDNISDNDFVIERGRRLFQICAFDLSPISIEIVDSLDETKRGTAGFGSTGTSS